jgi:hypothetical protein
MTKTYLAGVMSGFVGGLLGAYVLGHLDRGVRPPLAAPPSVSTMHQQDVVSASRIRLLDPSGKARAELAMSQGGGPGLFFYDTKGRNRLVVGLYPPPESEYPLLVLNDSQELAAGIFRLFGGHETPVLVLKHKGQDRSIYGLNPASTDPFLTNYARDQKKTDVFGNY